MADNGRVIVLVRHHCQPPIETQAAIWDQVMEFDPETPVREVFEQAWTQGDVVAVSMPKQP